MAAVSFRDFTGGESGRKGLHQIAPNEWTGLNMLVYPNGLLGPRWGLTSKYWFSGATRLGGLSWIGFPGALWFAHVDNSWYRLLDAGAVQNFFNAGNPVDGPHGAANRSFERTQVAFYDPNGFVYITQPGLGTLKVWWPDPTSPAPAQIQIAGSTGRGFRGIRLHKDRLLLWHEYPVDPAKPPHRVWFSNAAAFDTFPATNYVDLPSYYWEPYSGVPLGNHLFFPQRQVGWTAWIGGSPASLQLRQVYTDPPALAIGSGTAQSAYLLDQGACWWIRQGGSLSLTNGAQWDQTSFAHLGFDEPIPADLGGCTLESSPGKTLVFLNYFTDRALVRHWGVWSQHSFDETLGEDHITPMATRTEFGNSILLGVKQAGGIRICEWPFNSPTAPPPSSQTDLGVAYQGQFTLPEFNHPEGKDIRVRQLRIKVEKYGAGCGFTAEVSVASTWSPNESTEGWYTETFPVSLNGGSSSGVPDQIILNFGHQGWWSTARIAFKNVVGLAFKDIVVITDEQDGREVR